MVGVTQWDKVRNDEIRRRAWIEETVPEKVARRALRWFGHVEKMDESRWQRNIKAALVECHQGRGGLRFFRLGEMKRTLDVREEGLQEATQFARERTVWRELIRV